MTKPEAAVYVAAAADAACQTARKAVAEASAKAAAGAKTAARLTRQAEQAAAVRAKWKSGDHSRLPGAKRPYRYGYGTQRQQPQSKHEKEESELRQKALRQKTQELKGTMRKAATRALREALTTMYAAAEPSKVGNVDSILTRYNIGQKGLQASQLRPSLPPSTLRPRARAHAHALTHTHARTHPHSHRS